MLVRDTFAPLKAWLGLSTLLAAADTDKIVESTNMKNGAYTIANQPSVPSKLGVATTAVDTADTQGIVTFVGTDFYDRALTEAVTPVPGSTVYTTHYFKTLTSATGSGWAIDAVEGSNDTIIIGVLASCGIEGVKGQPVTIEVVSGTVYVNDRAVAVADVTSIQRTAGQTMDLVPTTDVVSLIANGSTATVQIYVWGM